MILTIRADKPEAEIGLFEGQNKLAYETWEAHRQLAETIHIKIKELLGSQKKDWDDITGVVCFGGPGSFTGLRIGITVGNSLANNLKIPIVGATGDAWLKEGIAQLLDGHNMKVVLPHYGRDPHITVAKK